MEVELVAGDMVPGTVRKMTLANFMQYNEVSFEPGRHLNVILGPNGSGKSSLILAFALGLAGKLSTLGRASHIAEYIRTGQERASITIELFRSFTENRNGVRVENRWTIERVWGQDGKSIWKLDGRNVSQKTVEQLVKELNIQTGNLCQFLPQDKVHEFSRMNPKELLVKTVEAVGETQLKEDHEKLKQLQIEMTRNAEIYSNRSQTLEENKRKFVGLEEKATQFKEKEALEKKIRLLEQKRDLCLFQEQLEIVTKAKKSHLKVLKELREKKDKAEPLKLKLDKKKKVQNELGLKTKAILTEVKDCVQKAKLKSERIEAIEDRLDYLDETLELLEENEQKKREEISEIERGIEELEADLNKDHSRNSEVDLNSIEPKLKQLRKESQNLGAENSSLEDKLSSLQFEMKSMHSRSQNLERELEIVRNVDKLRSNVLGKLPQGQDAKKGWEWVQSHQDQFNGQIYRPMMLELEMKNPSDSFILENSIPLKDMVAFSGLSAEDVNFLTNELRGRQHLSANVVHVNADSDSSKYEPNFHLTPDQIRTLDFKGLAKDLFNSPEPIKDYLCRMYQLHQIAIFGPGANRHVDKIVNELKIRSFFIGNTKYVVKVSRYSGKTSTTSNEVTAKQFLHFSTDKAKEREILKNIKGCKDRVAKVELEKAQLVEDRKTIHAKVEEIKSEMSKLINQKEQKTKIQGRIERKRQELQKVLAKDFSNEESREKFDKEKIGLGKETAKLAKELQQCIFKGNNLKIQSSLVSMKKRYAMCGEDELQRNLEEVELEISEINERAVLANETLKAAEAEANGRKRTARESIGDEWRADGPSKKLEKAFSDAKLPETSDKCEAELSEAQNTLDYMDDINPDVVRDYLNLKKTIEDMEAEVANYQEVAEANRAAVETIRERWLTKLQELIEKIAGRFGHYFSSMGFAGDVLLNQGNDENDFQNFGVDIMVKYRSNEPMQRLNPHQQSGGERSVATALYMMALQELTVVPFRCVDEINQGMDAINERRVFDLLVQISCRENSAQYFLLTPKLLPNLNYDKNMNVLTVNNGDEMCHHERWDMKEFIRVAQTVAI